MTRKYLTTLTGSGGLLLKNRAHPATVTAPGHGQSLVPMAAASGGGQVVVGVPDANYDTRQLLL